VLFVSHAKPNNMHKARRQGAEAIRAMTTTRAVYGVCVCKSFIRVSKVSFEQAFLCLLGIHVVFFVVSFGHQRFLEVCKNTSIPCGSYIQQVCDFFIGHVLTKCDTSLKKRQHVNAFSVRDLNLPQELKKRSRGRGLCSC